MEKEDINHEVTRFQINVANTIFEQALEYLLWKVEQHKDIESLKKNLLADLKKIHKKNMKYIEHRLNNL